MIYLLVAVVDDVLLAKFDHLLVVHTAQCSGRVDQRHHGTHGLATHFGNNARSSFHHKSHGESTPIFFKWLRQNGRTERAKIQ